MAVPPCPPSHTATHMRAFTLVELAVVLAILGLLVGGILGGKSILSGASMQSTITQLTDTKLAVRSFYEKYKNLPGDSPRASTTWATATDGNGNGLIEAATTTGSLTTYEPENPNFDGERSQFFLHLALAGLTPMPHDASATLNKGYPAVAMYPNTGMFVAGRWVDTASSNMSIHTYTTDNLYLYVGVCNPSRFNVNADYNDCGVFNAVESRDIDKKIDDGKPLSGMVLGQSGTTTCVSGSAYAVGSESNRCNLLYNLR